MLFQLPIQVESEASMNEKLGNLSRVAYAKHRCSDRKFAVMRLN